jgi:hypothetical protein
MNITQIFMKKFIAFIPFTLGCGKSGDKES